MRGHCGTDFSFQQGLDNGNRQGCALRRVCPCAKLIEQHQRVIRHLIHNFHDIRHVCRKGTQALLNALFIPDAREHIIKHRQLRIIKCRNMQSCLPHQRKQPQGFQGNRFPAGVRACNHQRGKFLPQINICRHNLFRVKQRMSALVDIDVALCIKQGLCPIHGKGKICLCKNKVKLRQQFQIPLNRKRICRHHIRKGNQNLFDFFLFLRLQLLDFIVQLNHTQGLHKQRRACVGLIVNHSRKGASVFRLNRHAISVITNGNHKILQHIAVCRGIDNPIQMLLHPFI